MLLILSVEQLRRGFADQHGGNGRQDRLGQHVTAVVGQGVEHNRLEAVHPVGPDGDAGDEVAHKAQEDGQRYAADGLCPAAAAEDRMQMMKTVGVRPHAATSPRDMKS